MLTLKQDKLEQVESLEFAHAAHEQHNEDYKRRLSDMQHTIIRLLRTAFIAGAPWVTTLSMTWPLSPNRLGRLWDPP